MQPARRDRQPARAAATPLPTPQPSSRFVRRTALDLVLGFVTLYCWNFWVQYQQILAVNELVGEKRFSFLRWNLWVLLTLGLFIPFHEINLNRAMHRAGIRIPLWEQLLAFALFWFGLHPVSDAIRQERLNRHFRAR